MYEIWLTTNSRALMLPRIIANPTIRPKMEGAGKKGRRRENPGRPRALKARRSSPLLFVESFPSPGSACPEKWKNRVEQKTRIGRLSLSRLRDFPRNEWARTLAGWGRKAGSLNFRHASSSRGAIWASAEIAPKSVRAGVYVTWNAQKGARARIDYMCRGRL